MKKTAKLRKKLSKEPSNCICSSGNNITVQGTVIDPTCASTADGMCAVAEGQATRADGRASHAEGILTSAQGTASHAEGSQTQAVGNSSHAEGVITIALMEASHAEGSFTEANGSSCHAEGLGTIAREEASHTEGRGTLANAPNSHAEGNQTRTDGQNSHAEGFMTVAGGFSSHAEGRGTTAVNQNSHAEGLSTTANGFASHTEGIGTNATEDASHAEGNGTIASGLNAHSEGFQTTASGDNGHAEGRVSRASGFNAHAEGNGTIAAGINAHSEGFQTQAAGNNSHAEGRRTIASGVNSHAEGHGTSTFSMEGAHIMGRFGRATNTYSWHLANGTSDANRSIAAIIRNDGIGIADNGWVAGNADFAEMFETVDGKTIEPGYFVTLDGKKIKKATQNDEYIVGVTTSTPAFLADAAELRWKDKYLTDGYGNIRYHEVTIPEVKDNRGNIISPESKEIQPILNPKWDNKKEYVPRTEREEWVPVALMGKVVVRDDGTCKVNGYCIPNNDGVATSKPKGYRVLERVGKNQVLILLI